MNLETLYHHLCHSGETAATLDRTADATLAAMYSHLEAAGVTTGVPGIIIGLVEMEIVRRWVAQNLGNQSPVGEG